MRQVRYFLPLAFTILMAASATAEPPSAKDYQAYWAPIVGNWKVAIKTADKTHEGEWKLQSGEGQLCLQGNANLPGLIQATTLEGFDALTKGWKRIWFDSEGGHQLDRVTVDNVAKAKLETGAVVRVDSTLVAPDGKQTSYGSHWKFAKIEADLVEITVTNSPLGPEATLTLTRIK